MALRICRLLWPPPCACRKYLRDADRQVLAQRAFILTVKVLEDTLSELAEVCPWPLSPPRWWPQPFASLPRGRSHVPTCAVVGKVSTIRKWQTLSEVLTHLAYVDLWSGRTVVTLPEAAVHEGHVRAQNRRIQLRRRPAWRPLAGYLPISRPGLP